MHEHARHSTPAGSAGRRPQHCFSCRSVRRHAAIDYQLAASHPGRVVRCQVEAAERDVGWLTKPAPTAWRPCAPCRSRSQKARALPKEYRRTQDARSLRGSGLSHIAAQPTWRKSARRARQNITSPGRRCHRRMRRASRLVEPDRIQAHDVEDAEIGGRVKTLDVIVPDLVDPFPGDRQQRRVLLHDGFGLMD